MNPDVRIDTQLSLPPTKRKAPVQIIRRMKHGSILIWVETLEERVGALQEKRAENFVARKIAFTGTTLATILDEFHPTAVVFSATVKNIVPILVLLEETLKIEKDKLGNVYLQNWDL